MNGRAYGACASWSKGRRFKRAVTGLAYHGRPLPPWCTPLNTLAPLPASAQAFHDALDHTGRAWLSQLRARCAQPVPAGWISWRTPHQALGWLRPERAALLQAGLDGCAWEGADLVWDCTHWDGATRSARLQAFLRRCQAQGLLPGWRDEAFAFWFDGCPEPAPDQAPLLSVERAGFRFLGLMSHAVHLNGFTPEGALWCGRRSANKATDPGLLDNVTAGGLPAGESPLDCARRELWEEAGLHWPQDGSPHNAGWVRTRRAEPEGWHDESLLVINLTLQAQQRPHNQDGEVQEFLCLEAPEVLRRLQAGEFTLDAAASLAQGLGL
ncbi:NUDIX domain-containing protein [uncultured Rhodoferax sp.]|uniref:NUDIX hydrolase n=1 Tax=uncultured Rhodoferax sp. TaxID=223188 RepID=UPI0025F35CDA|nr:NUDIX domain-containing protein [uncultured Rhodoferax sp.]